MIIKTVTRSATNTKGKRIRVSTVEDSGVSIIVPWNWALDISDNHLIAAQTLLERIGLGHFFVEERAIKGGERYFSVDGEN